MSKYQKGKTNLDLLEQEIVSGSGVSAGPYSSLHFAPDRITMPASHSSVFYRPDALHATQPTASKHWRQCNVTVAIIYLYFKFYSFRHCKKLPAASLSLAECKQVLVQVLLPGRSVGLFICPSVCVCMSGRWMWKNSWWPGCHLGW